MSHFYFSREKLASWRAGGPALHDIFLALFEGLAGPSTEALGCTASLCAPEKLVSPDVPAVPSRYCTPLPTVSFSTVLILSPREIMLVSTLNSATRALTGSSFERYAKL